VAEINNIRNTPPVNWPLQTRVKSADDNKEQHARNERDKDDEQESDDDNHIDEYA